MTAAKNPKIATAIKIMYGPRINFPERDNLNFFFKNLFSSWFDFGVTNSATKITTPTKQRKKL